MEWHDAFRVLHMPKWEAKVQIKPSKLYLNHLKCPQTILCAADVSHSMNREKENAIGSAFRLFSIECKNFLLPEKHVNTKICHRMHFTRSYYHCDLLNGQNVTGNELQSVSASSGSSRFMFLRILFPKSLGVLFLLKMLNSLDRDLWRWFLGISYTPRGFIYPLKSENHYTNVSWYSLRDPKDASQALVFPTNMINQKNGQFSACSKAYI